MNILIALYTGHQYGCKAIAQSWLTALCNAGHNAHIALLPGDSDKGTFYPIPLSKKSYDLILAVEFLPPYKWTESGRIVWLPMGELTFIDQIRETWSSLTAIWHNKDAYEKATAAAKWMRHKFINFGDVNIASNNASQQKQDKIRLLIQNRVRGYDAEMLLNKIRRFAHRFIIRVHDETDKIKDLDMDIVETLLHGHVPRDKMIALLNNCDAYVAPRTQEGAGLLVHEAALNDCAVIGPNQATYSHTIAIPELTFETGPDEQEWNKKHFLPVQVHTERSYEQIAAILEALTPEKAAEYAARQKQMIADQTASFAANAASMLVEDAIRNTANPGLNYRNQGLVLNYWQHGGASVFDMLSTRELEKLDAWSWLRISGTTSYTKHEPMYVGQMLSKGRTRTLAPDAKAVERIKPNLIIAHWSGTLKNILDQTNDSILRQQYETTESILQKHTQNITWIHEIATNDVSPGLGTGIVVYPSQNALETYFRAGIKFKAQRVVPHFLDPALTIKRNVLSPFTFVVLGRVAMAKIDMRYLIGLAKLFKRSGARLLFIGEGDPKIWRMLDNCGIEYECKTEFDPQAKSELLAGCHVLLHFSPVQETFCLAALEAAAFGCAIVTNRPELRETAGDDVIVVNCPEEALAVCDALLVNKERTAEIGSNCAKVAVQKTCRVWLDNVTKLIAEATRSTRTFSVVVFATNEGKLVERAIDSAANQCDEIIVVISGSDQETRDAVKNARSITGKAKMLDLGFEKKTQATALAAGTDAAENETIVFLDGDDELLPGAIASIERAYANHPDAVMVYTMHERFDCTRNVIEKDQLSIDHCGRMLQMMEEGKTVVSHAVSAPRWAVKMAAIDQSLEAACQLDLALRLDELGKCAFWPEKTYRYYANRKGSVTSDNARKQETARSIILTAAKERRRRK